MTTPVITKSAMSIGTPNMARKYPRPPDGEGPSTSGDEASEKTSSPSGRP